MVLMSLTLLTLALTLGATSGASAALRGAPAEDAPKVRLDWFGASW